MKLAPARRPIDPGGGDQGAQSAGCADSNEKAARLYETLSAVPRKNAIWGALVSYTADYRYPVFWQGLESMFGTDDDSPGNSRRLRERISFFLADDGATQQQLCDMVSFTDRKPDLFLANHRPYKDALNYL